MYSSYRQLRFVTAWSLVNGSSRTNLGPGLLEVDSTKIWTKRSPTRKELQATKASNKRVEKKALELMKEKVVVVVAVVVVMLRNKQRSSKI